MHDPGLATRKSGAQGSIIEGIVMITDSELKSKGLQILAKYLGNIEAEKFIALIQREPFDYTKWRQDLDEDLSVEEISRLSFHRNENRR